MQEIQTRGAEILAAIIVMALSLLLMKCRVYFAEKVKAGQDKWVDKLIYDFVSAAEQQFKVSDPTGKVRLDYVTELLQKMGIEITEIIKAKIESTVLDMPKKIE